MTTICKECKQPINDPLSEREWNACERTFKTTLIDECSDPEKKMPLFSYRVARGLLLITDHNSAPKVIDCIGSVLSRIYSDHPELKTFNVVCKDTKDRYDGVEVVDGKIVGVHLLQAYDLEDAVTKLAIMSR